jgi:hypothetical protein
MIKTVSIFVLFCQKKWRYALVTEHLATEEEASSFENRLRKIPIVQNLQVSHSQELL